jgi:hypothetical protein
LVRAPAIRPRGAVSSPSARRRSRAAPPSAPASRAQGSASLCCNSCDDVRETYGRIRIVPPPSAHGGGVGGLGGQMDWRVHPLCAHDAQLIDPGALGGTHEGCAVEGFLHVNKVAGNFHIAPGRAFASPQGHLVHEFKPFEMGAYNTTHVINSLSFGPHYPNQVRPRTAHERARAARESGPASHVHRARAPPPPWAHAVAVPPPRAARALLALRASRR